MNKQNNGRGTDSLLESLESMQKAINHVRAQLDKLPRRIGVGKRRSGVRAIVHDHPVATACVTVLALVLLTGIMVLLLRRKR
ncbi:MAG: hypothetical protein GF331_02985 [Chitinivibrionales bacterium]|nr:hypothetical protein [Chitinivibrionales bacterium]